MHWKSVKTLENTGIFRTLHGLGRFSNLLTGYHGFSGKTGNRPAQTGHYRFGIWGNLPRQSNAGACVARHDAMVGSHVDRA
jgi:hypothetical protein